MLFLVCSIRKLEASSFLMHSVRVSRMPPVGKSCAGYLFLLNFSEHRHEMWLQQMCSGALQHFPGAGVHLDFFGFVCPRRADGIRLLPTSGFVAGWGPAESGCTLFDPNQLLTPPGAQGSRASLGGSWGRGPPLWRLWENQPSRLVHQALKTGTDFSAFPRLHWFSLRWETTSSVMNTVKTSYSLLWHHARKALSSKPGT